MGKTPEWFLSTSPLYRKPVVIPLQSDLPMDDLTQLSMQASQMMDMAKVMLETVYRMRKERISA